jgi:hypothetical protein
MKKLVVVTLVLMALLLVSVGTVLAITDGELDGENHPNVGLMVAQAADGSPLWRCSGTMLSPTVFLTAGHCVEDPAALATVWFDADVQAGIPDNGYPFGCGDDTVCFTGTAHQYPEYDPATWWMDDVGVVVLDEPYVLDEYGALPVQDQLDVLKTKRGKQDTTFTAVGYGLQQSNPVHVVAERVRMVAYPQLIQINVPGQVGDFSLLLSNNPNTGGTCFGDSGGPNFLNDTNIVAGVTSYGKNGNCAGTGGVFRMDREGPLNWVSSFLGE